ncbi:MAG: glycoside hydrolase family 20 zincin-like fold domain-containing protein [Anaerolineae bacterium]
MKIYPCPQWLNRGQGVLRVWEEDVSIWLDPACEPMSAAIDHLIQSWGFPLRTAADAESATIAVGVRQSAAISSRIEAELLCSEGEIASPLSEPLPAEGYVLMVDQGGITVAGADPSGCLYGLGTLSQILSHADGQIEVPCLQVRDWPYKPMRGAHIYMPAREDIPFFKGLLAWLSSLRYNALFLEVGGGMRYDRHPEVNEAWVRFCDEARAYPGGPQALQGSQRYPKDSTHIELAGGRWLEKEEVADIICFANSYGIEIIPELQSLSHAYYMVLAHPEIAERADDPWPDTYCPSDPRSYDLYFDLLDEVIGVFKPRMVHIGHDEAYSFGIDARCRSKSGAELLAGDLIKIHDYLAAKGIRTVLWGDKLQNIIIGGENHGGRARRAVWSEQMDYTMLETYQAVDFVPKDMLIMDWYWELDPLSEQFFQQKGFQVIFGNFGNNFAPQTFQRWQDRSSGDNVVGAEVSTWCDVSEYALGHNLALYNFLFSANMLWWNHYHDRERETNLTAVARLQSQAREALSRVPLPSRHDAAAEPLMLPLAGTAADNVVASAKGKWTQVAPAPFVLVERAMVADTATPNSQAIVLNRKAAGLAFLHYCLTERQLEPTWGFVDPLAKDDHNLLGHYLVTYADGATERVEIRYGDNISRPDLMYGEDVASCPFWAQPAWEGRDHACKRVTLWAHEWVNPQPDKDIASVSLHYTGADPQEWIALLALTALG